MSAKSWVVAGRVTHSQRKLLYVSLCSVLPIASVFLLLPPSDRLARILAYDFRQALRHVLEENIRRRLYHVVQRLDHVARERERTLRILAIRRRGADDSRERHIDVLREIVDVVWHNIMAFGPFNRCKSTAHGEGVVRRPCTIPRCAGGAVLVFDHGRRKCVVEHGCFHLDAQCCLLDIVRRRNQTARGLFTRVIHEIKIHQCASILITKPDSFDLSNAGAHDDCREKDIDGRKH